MKNLAIMLAIALGLCFTVPLTNPVLSFAQDEGSEGSDESAPEAPAPQSPDDGGADTGD